MDEKQRWQELVTLDDELLGGGVMLSEWCARIVVDSDTAYAAGAFLASIMTAVSGIEAYLRTEHGGSGKPRLTDLVDASSLPTDLKVELHDLRRYRNKWVHANAPNDDSPLLNNPASVDGELEDMARRASRALRHTIYTVQWV
jgi:hypothetical protein